METGKKKKANYIASMGFISILYNYGKNKLVVDCFLGKTKF